MSDLKLDEVVSELDLILELIPEWRLPAEGWVDVHVRLESAKRRLELADVIGLQQVVIELERLGVSRLGSLTQTDADEAEAAPDPLVQIIVEIRSAYSSDDKASER